MRVLLTGGAGLIGRAIRTYLHDRGYDVRIIDTATPPDDPAIDYAQVNVLDFDAVRQQMRGCDAVVHMAAISNPYPMPGHEVVRINTTGAYTVFEAAAQEGIRRVVQASSINAIGCAWNLGDFAPLSLPVDESQPRLPQDPYSFSKAQIEDIGAYFWRRDGISGTALRFPAVVDAALYGSAESLQRRAATHAFLDELAALPDAKRGTLMAEAQRSGLEWRARRPMEWPNPSSGVTPAQTFEERLWHAYTLDRFNLWAWIDARDAAQAVEKSLSAQYDGAHAIFATDTHNWLDYDAQTLARLFFPAVPAALEGTQSLVSTRRARDLIGFEPVYTAPAASAA